MTMQWQKQHSKALRLDNKHKRLHSLLGYLPPVEFNKRLALNFVV